MDAGTSGRLVLSITIGYAAIFNLLGTSYHTYFHTTLLMTTAFCVGITMVFGSLYVLISEPMPRRKTALPLPFLLPVKNPTPTPVN